MERINKYQSGSTVRLQCEFYDFEGKYIDPELTKITIYDSNRRVIYSQTLTSEDKKSVGKYYVDYVTDKREQRLYYEWYGVVNGKPSLERGIIATTFI